MISRLGTDLPLDTPEMLASLSQQLSDDPVEKQRASNRVAQPRVLDLHLVPQLPLADLASSIPVLSSAYPAPWKQQVRQLRNHILHYSQDLFSRDGFSLKTVSIFSLRQRTPRQGLAPNLAFALASLEEARVLYLDGKGTQADLAFPDSAGLCAAVRAHREDLPPCFRRVSGTQFYFLPYGAPTIEHEPVNPRGLQRLLDGLRTQFDWIIIDAPSFETPADASLLSLCSDGSLFVVGRERDSFADLEAALRLAQSRHILGAVTV